MALKGADLPNEKRLNLNLHAFALCFILDNGRPIVGISVEDTTVQYACAHTGKMINIGQL